MQLDFKTHSMDLAWVNQQAQQSTAEASTNRETSKVKINKPEVFRQKLGCLKDRLSSQLNTEPKKKCKKFKTKSRNEGPGETATWNNINKIKLNYNRPEYLVEKDVWGSQINSSIPSKTLNTRYNTNQTETNQVYVLKNL